MFRIYLLPQILFNELGIAVRHFRASITTQVMGFSIWGEPLPRHRTKLKFSVAQRIAIGNPGGQARRLVHQVGDLAVQHAGLGLDVDVIHTASQGVEAPEPVA